LAVSTRPLKISRWSGSVPVASIASPLQPGKRRGQLPLRMVLPSEQLLGAWLTRRFVGG
jgi:hypothetical protein